VPGAFLSLAKKDDSFSAFLAKSGLLSSQYVYKEDNVAQDIRKVLPSVIARDYYLKHFRGDRSSFNRSRKSYDLYTGYPSIIEITEGNPRAILTLAGPLVADLSLEFARGSQPNRISRTLQRQRIRTGDHIVRS